MCFQIRNWRLTHQDSAFKPNQMLKISFFKSMHQNVVKIYSQCNHTSQNFDTLMNDGVFSECI